MKTRSIYLFAFALLINSIVLIAQNDMAFNSTEDQKSERAEEQPLYKNPNATVAEQSHSFDKHQW